MTKTIVITGAGTGIGAATATAFLTAGWNVCLLGRRLERLTAVAQGHAAALCIACDVTVEPSVDQAFSQAVAKFGRLDAVFNNAGVFPDAGTIDEMSVEAWRQVVDVNLTGAFITARAGFAAMRSQTPQGGRIINNGSIAAQSPRPKSAAYTATKHAITGLTKSISLDGREFDIACGQIDVGNANTDMVANISASVGGAVHTMDVSHVADAVLHMASLPKAANVQFMTVMATKMPFIGRG